MTQFLADRLFNWWKLFQDGGPVMYPILFCSIFGLAITFERLWTLRIKNVIVNSEVAKAKELLDAGKVEDAKNFLKASPTRFSRVLLAGIAKMKHRRVEIRDAMENAGGEEGYDMSKGVDMLGGLANLAPLLGFLGTVYGMISAFYAIYATGVTTSSNVAGGIAQALITTAGGLTVSIPLYIAYRYFAARVDFLLIEMERASADFMDIIDHLGGLEERDI